MSSNYALSPCFLADPLLFADLSSFCAFAEFLDPYSLLARDDVAPGAIRAGATAPLGGGGAHFAEGVG